MTRQTPSQPDAAKGQYPLSYTQEYFCSLDEGDANMGAFGNRFHLITGLRIAGRVDVPALQGALDDVVERHELLRTVVMRDAKPAYQQVHPPCRVPLEVRDMPATDRPRDLVAEELLIEAERSTISARQVPVVRATLSRFDDDDSVLVITTHHSATDAWSVGVIMRDLAACYDARAKHHPVDLPPVKQYREFAAWQRTGGGEIGDDVRAYWRDKLRGGHVLALPNDRPRPQVYSRPFSGYNYMVGADEMAAAVKFAHDTRSSMFMVLLAAFGVFSHELTGRADPAIRAFMTGRDEPQFHNTMGLFLNLVPFRTDISRCASFREIVAATRDTCIDAYSHEVPITVIEQEVPDFNAPNAEAGNSEFVLGMWQQQSDAEAALPIADGAEPIFKRTLPSYETSDIPRGLVWNMAVAASGELAGNITYNLDEFDEQTVTSRTAQYHRILSRLTSEPDSQWRQLAAVAS